MPLANDFNDVLDAYGLPYGLPDRVYASWLGALRDVKDSPSLEVGRERYQFCCGYVQALEDGQILGPGDGRSFSSQVQKLWVEVSATLNARGI